MADSKKPSLLSKLLTAGEIGLDSFIAKSRSEIAQEEDDAFYRKSVYRDPSLQPGTQGWFERGTKIGFLHLRHMSMKDTIVANIIQTRQNDVAAYARPVQDPAIKGFRVIRKKEEKALEEIMKELFGEPEDLKTKLQDQQNAEEQKEQTEDLAPEGEDNSPFTESKETESYPFGKASSSIDSSEEAKEVIDESTEAQGPVESAEVMEESGEPLTERQKIRLAKAELKKRDADKIESLTEFMANCGYLEDRPFESRRWDMNATLRAMVRDRFTYDLHATETVNDQVGEIHHFVPADGSTIRLLSPEFAQYKQQDLTAGYDIIYPEKELEALKEGDAFTPDPEKIAEGDYKFAQIIRGRIERAFTPDEMCIGMCNPTADIYSNGYSISELELLIGTVTSHIFTENYNHSYFSDGFSAKGILHIKAPVNRRKLETIRLQWKHMISGAKNSFHTPIFSGMDEIQWIPLTQNHSDMEFSNWMNYLIKIICGIYQIDPSEIGFGMKDEGGAGGGLNGDNTAEKLQQGKDKGLRPLLIHIQNFFNKNIMSRLDDDFEFEFCGLEKETPKEMTDRQASEVKFKKTVNEIREENNQIPIPGADDLILDPVYYQWFLAFHPDGQKLAQKNAAAMGLPPGQNPPPGANVPPGADDSQNPEEGAPAIEEAPADDSANPVEKSSKDQPTVIEYFLNK